MFLLPFTIPTRGLSHDTVDRNKIKVEADIHSNPSRPVYRRPATKMAELAKQIIRQQWPKRHDNDQLTRSQAVSLIKTHIVMLRQWRKR